MGAQADESGPRTQQGVFVWPPRPPQPLDATIVEEAVLPSRARFSGCSEALRKLEDFWLAPIAYPLARRLLDQSIHFSSFGEYCDRCGVSTGQYEADDFGCAACRDENLPWDRAVRLGEYLHGLGQCVIDIKFGGQRRLARDLGKRLGSTLISAGAPREQVAVVPVAMAWTRRFARPFDHAREIALGVADTTEAPLVNAFRRKHRPSQRSVPASQRRANVRGSFRPRRGVDFTGWTVVLVDDVRTTGATLTEAAKTLRRMGAATIWTAVLAVTPSADRRADNSAVASI